MVTACVLILCMFNILDPGRFADNSIELWRLSDRMCFQFHCSPSLGLDVCFEQSQCVYCGMHMQNCGKVWMKNKDQVLIS